MHTSPHQVPLPPFLRWLRGFGLRPTMLVLMLSDAIALEITAVAAYVLRALPGIPMDASLYTNVMPLLLIGPVLSVTFNTCQSISLPPHKEIKQLFLATSLTYLIILAVFFLTQEGNLYSRLMAGGAWLCSLWTVPLLRGVVRERLCRKPWWGRPVVFLRQGQGGEELWDHLENNPERGLRPVERACLAPTEHERSDQLAALREAHPDAIAMLYLSDDSAGSAFLVRQISLYFPSVLLVPSLTTGEDRFWLTPRDLGCAVGLLVRQNLLDARRLRAKRWLDLSLTLTLGILALPLGLLVALAIRLDSKGPALYTQRRIGQNGKLIAVYKFRTMVLNADTILKDYLQAHPDLHDEWKDNQKLRHDPRVTRVGALLRKTSLDELPQLWNVFCGTMSLVGPRPIVANEIDRYGRVYMDYSLVKPGITGLWQVSGRNNTTYAERIRLDHYYVTNWSVWMDIWILARTIPVVLLGRGAY